MGKGGAMVKPRELPQRSLSNFSLMPFFVDASSQKIVTLNARRTRTVARSSVGHKSSVTLSDIPVNRLPHVRRSVVKEVPVHLPMGAPSLTAPTIHDIPRTPKPNNRGQDEPQVNPSPVRTPARTLDLEANFFIRGCSLIPQSNDNIL